MDAATINALHTAAFGHEGAHGWREPDFEAALANSAYTILATHHGYVLCRRLFDEAELILIAALPPYRRQGVASDLLQRAESSLVQAGATRLMLEVVATNRPAIEFYLSKGFREVGTRPGYYGPDHDALLYEKSLKS